jgi:hypothetical protein
MPTVIADRVKVTTTTTGTGTLTLGSAVTGFQDFGVIGDGNETYYTISVPGGADFEVGIGTFTASGTTLSRDTILTSSNGGLAVNLSAGTKDVFVTYPAERSVVSLEGNNSEFPAGTRMIFAQTTAPTGFTKDTLNYDQHALRVVTGTASPGGTVDFTTAFASQTPTGNVSVTASTGLVAQGGSVSTSTGQVAQGGSVSTSTGNTTQGGTVSTSTGNTTQGGTVSSSGSGSTGQTTAGGNISVSTGQVAGPVSVGNTTLSTPTIPSHAHNLLNPDIRSPIQEFLAPPGVTSTQIVPFGNLNNTTSNTGNVGSQSTGGSGAHSHPGSGGQHAHPASASFAGTAHGHNVSISVSSTFTGQPHNHPASSSFTGQPHNHPASSTFTGSQHDHPASSTFTGSQHDHPVSAPATFTGSAINLAVKYVDVITATKD